MKRTIFTSVLSLVLGLLTTPMYALPRFEVLKLGDVNRDGNVDMNDALILLAFAVGEGELSVCPSVADVNQDKAVNIADTVLILGYINGEVDFSSLDDWFTCSPPRSELEALALEPVLIPATVEQTADGQTSLTLGYIPVEILDGPKGTDIRVDIYGDVGGEPNGRMVRFIAVGASGENVAEGWACVASLDGEMVDLNAIVLISTVIENSQ